MNRYSIVKIGRDYIVMVDDIATLKFTSRRKAMQLVADAAGLLDTALAEATLAAVSASITAASMVCDRAEAA